MLNHNILHKILLKLDSQTWYKTQLASSYFHICYKNDMYHDEEKRLYKEYKLIDSGVYIFDFNNIKIGDHIIIYNGINSDAINLIKYIVKKIGHQYDKIIYLSYFNNIEDTKEFNELNIIYEYMKDLKEEFKIDYREIFEYDQIIDPKKIFDKQKKLIIVDKNICIYKKQGLDTYIYIQNTFHTYYPSFTNHIFMLRYLTNDIETSMESLAKFIFSNLNYFDLTSYNHNYDVIDRFVKIIYECTTNKYAAIFSPQLQTLAWCNFE